MSKGSNSPAGTFADWAFPVSQHSWRGRIGEGSEGVQIFEELGLPAWAGWMTLGILALILVDGLIFTWLFRRMEQRRAQTREQAAEILASGMPATALVLETSATGTERGGLLEVQLRLRVTPGDGGAPFESAVLVDLSPVRIADFAEGKVIAVRVDPATRQVVIAQRTR